MASYSSTPLSPLASQPPPSPSFLLSYPAPFTLLVTINRPQAMNAIPSLGHWEADAIFKWFDEESSLRIAIVTGAGKKAFCAGQDLIELGTRSRGWEGEGAPHRALQMHPPSGFAGLSRRLGKKPIIAAVNGFALGGGFEICLNCDLVVAAPTATFSLPETTRGLYAAAGGLPRLMHSCGLQIASEIALTGRRLSAAEAKSYGLVNRISASQESVIGEAIQMATEIVTASSPDALFVTRQGLREAWETASVERALQITGDRWTTKLLAGENLAIGLKAFAGKRGKPQWVSGKL